jgi:hypothetical protein
MGTQDYRRIIHRPRHADEVPKLNSMIVEALHLNLPSSVLQLLLNPLARTTASLAAGDPGPELQLLRNQIVRALPLKRLGLPGGSTPRPNRRGKESQGRGGPHQWAQAPFGIRAYGMALQ